MMPAAGSIHHMRATVNAPTRRAMGEGRDDADGQVLQRVDVLHDPGEEVTAAEGGSPAGASRSSRW